ncbi:hypothetical protein LSH36_38g04043 [Paralvinella palmiformis]|uniref:Uncharacterized protein n=1 Tax=Paralvinella palmiformis TaxID=53620 RepID=A0AAD9NFC7_9ANNE|nr:hypothetical protein LSH36_38g04043 [Paralvinella palmiformis]
MLYCTKCSLYCHSWSVQDINFPSQKRALSQSIPKPAATPPKNKVNLVISLTSGIGCFAVFGITLYYTYCVHMQREEYVSKLNEEKKIQTEDGRSIG